MTDAGKSTPAGRPAQPRKRRSSSPPRKSGATRPAAPADDAPLRDFATLRGRPAIFVVLHDSVQPAHLLLLRKEIGDRQFEELDFVIHSGGGDINTAYQMVQLIRQHTKRMNACVPLYAKSAATLWCLAANQIIMDESAELGPLDAQILEERRGGKTEYVSALNPFNTLERLRTFSLETLDTATMMIVRRSGLDLNESLQHAIRFVEATTGPLFSKLDPEKLGRYSRALAVGMAYGARVSFVGSVKRTTRRRLESSPNSCAGIRPTVTSSIIPSWSRWGCMSPSSPSVSAPPSGHCTTGFWPEARPFDSSNP